MKFNIPITISIACQSTSLAFIIITFILENWIIVNSTSSRYGMWRGCSSLECYNWYSNGEKNLNYTITNSFKAFQGLQSCMLGLIVITLVSLFFNLKFCSNFLEIFITDAILIFFAITCGLVSLIVFGTNIYEPDKHVLDWCFWLSLVALVLIFFGLIFLIAFSISIEIKLSSRPKSNARNESVKVYYATSNQDNKGPPVTEKLVNIKMVQNFKETNNESEIKPSPRFLKNTPTQSESKLKNRINAKNLEEEKNLKNDLSKKPNRNYWNKKNKVKRYRYHHEHYDEKKPSQENFKPGYNSEPDMIEYSLDRSWVSASNKLNTSMPILDEEPNDLTGTFNSRHFVKTPKLIYYDGSNHYTRTSPRN